MKKNFLFLLLLAIAGAMPMKADYINETISERTQIGGIYYKLEHAGWPEAGLPDTYYATILPKSTNASTNASYVSGNLTIPAAVTYGGHTFDILGIEKAAFRATNISNLTILADKITVGDSAFYGSQVRSIDIQSQEITLEDDYIFASCGQLQTVIFASNTTIHFSNFVNEIGGGIFQDCANLKSITFPLVQGLIPRGCFARCSSLEHVSFLQSYGGMCGYVFDDCSSLKTIRLCGPSTSRQYDQNALTGMPSSVVIYPPCGYTKGMYNSVWASYTFSNFEYVFSVTSESSERGSISIQKSPSCSDASAKISASPYAGWAFEAWYDKDNGNTIYSTQSNINISTVNRDLNLVAHFVKSDCSTNGVFPYQFNVTSENENKGAVSVIKVPDCDDASAQIGAYPYAGFAFDGWYDKDANLVYSYEPLTTISSVNRNMNLEAHFVESDCSTNGVFPYKFDVTSDNLAQGQVSVNKIPDCDDPSARIAAYPYAGYVFEAWFDNNTHTVYSYEPFTYVHYVSEDMSLTAHFLPGRHDCNEDGIFPYMFNAYSADESMGSIDITTPSCADKSARAYARPYYGYEFVIWGDGTTENPRTWSEVTKDVNVCAFFKQKDHGCLIDGVFDYLFKIEPNDYNKGMTMMTRTPDCSDNTTVIIAIAKEGYEFVRWSDGDKNATRTITVTWNTYLQGLFQDPANPIPDGLEDILSNDTPTAAKKVFDPETGNIYILLPDGRTYNLLGKEVK